MAEIVKNASSQADAIKSRVQQKASQVSERVSDATRNIVGTLQENRSLMYAGIAVLSAGIGFGVWFFVRGWRGRSIQRQPGFTGYGVDEYRRSGTY